LKGKIEIERELHGAQYRCQIRNIFRAQTKFKQIHIKNISVQGCAAWIGRVGDWQAGVCAQWVVGLPGSEWAGVCVRVAGRPD